MGDQAWMVGVRWALYVDLMLLSGVSWFAWWCGDGPPRAIRALVTACAPLGVLLSMAWLVLASMAMSAAPTLADVPAGTYAAVITDTAMGMACAGRAVVLSMAFVGALVVRAPRRWFSAAMAAAGALALATLAWNGHGAMDDGVVGYVHLAIDMAHLLAAAAWLGALVVLATRVATVRTSNHVALAALAHAMRGFATAGTIIVVTLSVTGVANYVLVAGMAWRPLVSTPYGELLLAKLSLFVLMLTLAALNRYRLGPRLHAALAGHAVANAVRHLRASLCIEAGLAITVVGLVAWLGTLAPDGG